MKREERPEKKEEENWEKGLPAPAAFGTLPWGAPLVRPGGRRFGLLGAKLGHSYSPQLHRQLGDYDYRLYEKPREELADFLSQPERETAGPGFTAIIRIMTALCTWPGEPK